MLTGTGPFNSNNKVDDTRPLVPWVSDVFGGLRDASLLGSTSMVCLCHLRPRLGRGPDLRSRGEHGRNFDE